MVSMPYNVVLALGKVKATLHDIYADGDMRASRPTPIFSKLRVRWSKASHAAREIVTVFSVTFFFSNSSWSSDQNAPPPIIESASANLCLSAQSAISLENLLMSCYIIK